MRYYDSPMIGKDQARRTAQILYPELWQHDSVDAVAKAIEFLYEAASAGAEPTNNSQANESAKIGGVVRNLQEHMSRHRMHVNVVARAIGVSSYTVRTWLEGKYKPNEDNVQKIKHFLEQLESTPQILAPEP